MNQAQGWYAKEGPIANQSRKIFYYFYIYSLFGREQILDTRVKLI